MIDLKGKHILITGASRGIGAGIARAAGRERTFARRDLCPLHERRTQVTWPTLYRA